MSIKEKFNYFIKLTAGPDSYRRLTFKQSLKIVFDAAKASEERLYEKMLPGPFLTNWGYEETRKAVQAWTGADVLEKDYLERKESLYLLRRIFKNERLFASYLKNTLQFSRFGGPLVLGHESEGRKYKPVSFEPLPEDLKDLAQFLEVVYSADDAGLTLTKNKNYFDKLAALSLKIYESRGIKERVTFDVSLAEQDYLLEYGYFPKNRIWGPDDKNPIIKALQGHKSDNVTVPFPGNDR